MSIGIFTDGKTSQSVMYCNISEIAFGPVFGEDENPQDFLDWAHRLGYPDVRTAASEVLGNLVDTWRARARMRAARKEVEENENEACAERYYSDTAAETQDEKIYKVLRDL